MSDYWVSVEGNIGAGKSTYMAELRRKHAAGADLFGVAASHDVYFIDEDLGAWDSVRDGDKSIFDLYYDEPARWALTFQTLVLTHRQQQILDTKAQIAERRRPGIIISERSLDSCYHVFMKMCAENRTMNSIEISTYKLLYDAAVRSGLSHIDLHLYCDTDVATCYAHCKQRNRKGETLDLAYLQQCDRFNRTWLQQTSTSVRPVRSDLDLRTLLTRRRIALCGAKRQGKSTLATLLCREHGCTELSFAGTLKSIATTLTGLPAETFEDEQKDHAHPTLQGHSPREYLCTLGAALRTTLRPYYPQHTNPIVHAIKHQLHHHLNSVISDCRMPAELAMLQEMDYTIIRISGRETTDQQDPTEQHVSTFPVDGEISNRGTTHDMLLAVKELFPTLL